MEPAVLDGYAEGVRARDPDAIAACYMELHEPLLRYLVGQCGDRYLAEDLMVQTFEELIRHGDRIRGGGDAIRAWLYRAARNNLIDEGRKVRRRRNVPLGDEAAERHAAPDPGPEALALDAIGDRQLQAAMARLSDDQREIIALRFGAGLSGPETAEATGKTVNAVKSLQHRALTTLARFLGAAGENS